MFNLIGVSFWSWKLFLQSRQMNGNDLMSSGQEAKSIIPRSTQPTPQPLPILSLHLSTTRFIFESWIHIKTHRFKKLTKPGSLPSTPSPLLSQRRLLNSSSRFDLRKPSNPLKRPPLVTIERERETQRLWMQEERERFGEKPSGEKESSTWALFVLRHYNC